MTTTRIYLDNAATSWPKPESVYRAADDYARQNGSAAGRGSHRLGLEATKIVDGTRDQLRALVHADPADVVAFCSNGTDALNLCIQGAVQPGDRVLTTAAEHNSVLRPLRQLQSRFGVDVTIIPVDRQGQVSLTELAIALQDHPSLVVINHASNVTGTIQPLEEIADLVRATPARLLVDAAQTIGALAIDLTQTPIDLLAFSGHKALLGPMGTGAAIIRHEFASRLRSLRQGGTGTSSESDHQPNTGVAKFEAGNLNMPGICGLAAGLTFVSENFASHRNEKTALTQQLLTQLAEIPGTTIYGPPVGADRMGVVSFNLAGLDCHDLAMILEQQAGIQVRSGLHCAPLVHRAIGTASRGGTLRASLGPFTTNDQIEALVDALRQLAGSVP